MLVGSPAYQRLTFGVRVRTGVWGGCWELAATPFGSWGTGSSEPASARYSSGPAVSSWSFTVRHKEQRQSKFEFLDQLPCGTGRFQQTFQGILHVIAASPSLWFLQHHYTCPGKKVRFYFCLPAAAGGMNSSFTFRSVQSQFTFILGSNYANLKP